MKIVTVETLLSKGPFATSAEWQATRDQLHTNIRAVDWPHGTGKFVIYPESGKKRGQGNGVKPIKTTLMAKLETLGWKPEQSPNWQGVSNPGGFDSLLREPRPVCMEWETGNVSSSHRALNKMCLALLKGLMVSGTLVVPTRALAKYLTDRIGNYEELVAYFDLWRSIAITEGVLEIVAVEHDDTSMSVPRIPKGTDGRAVS